MIKSTLTVQEDAETGEAFIVFPEEVMSELGWQEGDTVIWKDNGDGSWALTKENNEELSG